jgi:electron transfer flavoprotein beta subunit
MNILICVKAVPSKLMGNSYAGQSAYSINPYDAYSIGQMLELRKEVPSTITCVCMGPEGAKEVLVRCLAMGVDEAVLVSDPKFAGSDTFATSYILSKAVEKLQCDVIVCGHMAVDGETGQVQYGLAQRLGIPCISNVEDVQAQVDNTLSLKYVNDRDIYLVEAQTPVMISFNNLCEYTNINLFKLQQARKKPITVWSASDIALNQEECGLKGSKTKVFRSRRYNTLSREIELLDDTKVSTTDFLVNQIKIHQ